MNARTLTVINLVGVVTLATLCCFQWKEEVGLNRRIDDLLINKEKLELKITEHERTIKGLHVDLELFKSQYAAAQEELKETRDALKKSEAENAQLTALVEQLKANIESWKAAVKERDDYIAQANEHLKDSVEKINEGVQKYNDLAKQYNDLVALLNQRQEELAQAYKDLDETRRKLYKALGQPIPEPAEEKK